MLENSFLAILLAMTPAPSLAQCADGNKYYGLDPQTISCFQGGQLLIQHVAATRVMSTWTGQQTNITFRDARQQRRQMDVVGSSLSCLIERFGQESVPVRGRQ